MHSFNDFSLEPSLLQALDQLGFKTPTEIQSQCLPLLLQKGKIDFHGQAQTGTGKTLAFGLPLLQQCNEKQLTPQALIITPTRELAVQIQQQLRDFARFKKLSIVPLYGGISIEGQFNSLKKGAQIIIGTPGRLLDHISRKTVNLSDVKTVVLDEADIMLEMGFRDEVNTILQQVPDAALWLFSATVKPGIRQMMQQHMENPVSISVSKQHVTSSSTEQFYCVAPSRHWFGALCRFIEASPDFYGFVFCQTKILAAQVAEELSAAGYKAKALHGDMLQTQRNKVIAAFKKKEFSILVATDVAARGIDVSDLTHVINYGFPEDQESYIHRIGRTGRAGKNGIAITFIDGRRVYAIKSLAKRYNVSITEQQVPTLENILKHKLSTISDELHRLAKNQLPEHFHNHLNAMLSSLPVEEQRSLLLHFIHNTYLKSLASYDEQVSLDQARRETDRGQYSRHNRNRSGTQRRNRPFNQRKRHPKYAHH